MKRISSATFITLFLLIRVGFEVQAQNYNNEEELIRVLLEKDCAAAARFSESLKAADYESNFGFNLLMISSLSGCTEAARILIDKGASVNLQDEKYGITALMLASQEGHYEIVKLLLEKGANVNIQSPFGGTALIMAADKGHTEVVKLLLQNGADVELKIADSGKTALMLASAGGNTEIVRILLDNGAKPDLNPVVPDKILVSDAEMIQLKTDLLTMSDPFTLKDLYGFVTSTKTPKGGKEGATGTNSNSNLVTYYLATKGEKIDVISINSGIISIDLTFCGDIMCFFQDAAGKSYNPKRLFTLYAPSGDEPAGIFFEKIITWDTYIKPKNTYTFNEGKWYKQ